MEITNVAEQTVSANNNIVFSETAVKGSRCITHREGSGLINLRGVTNGNQCNARFLVEFGGNIAIPTGGTVDEISIAISINGEPLSSSQAIVTPAAVANYFNVSSFANVIVPIGDNLTVSVENTSSAAILVQNANLLVTRVA